MSASERWRSAGLQEVTLPSRFRVRGVLPQVEDLVREGAMPTELRAVAIRFATIGLTPDVEGDELRDFIAFARLLASRFVREIWDDETESWEPVSVTPEQFDGEALDPDDRAALIALVLRQRTAAQITAESLGLPVPEAGPVAGWESFRGESERPAPGPDGGEVRSTAVRPRGHLGPGGRPRARRSGRAAAGV